LRTTQLDPDGYFTLDQRDGRWWLITPEGDRFFTLGMNHIDPATMRYTENIDIWRNKYRSSTQTWIKESVVPNLKKWGFNSVGWTQEVTIRNYPHSSGFSAEDYKTLDMPYCHLLPFNESHQWDQFSRHYDFLSTEWEDWCDYVARAHVVELSQDPNLIGYFYSDCPTWVHTRPVNAWRGPIFDPEKLKSETGRKALSDLAHRYYKTTHDAIRRYDTHHLILGDRYEATESIPMEIVNSALPYIDIMSFQDFKEPVRHLNDWYRKTDKPVLLADSAGMKWNTEPGEISPNDGKWYSEVLSELQNNPGCIGFHICGAYQRNRARRYGLIDEMEIPDHENIDLITAANLETKRWVDSGN
jgi:hypothetical protein